MLIGTTPIPWPRFAAVDALACLIWASLGHASGHLIGRLLGPLQLHWHLALAAGAFLLVVLVLHRWQRRRAARN